MNGTCNSFVTLKDHKVIFMNHPTTRLINRSKNEVGRRGKYILDQLNTELICKLIVNEWKNTASVIKWFKNINNKKLYKFLQFNIKVFTHLLRRNRYMKLYNLLKDMFLLKEKT